MTMELRASLRKKLSLSFDPKRSGNGNWVVWMPLDGQKRFAMLLSLREPSAASLFNRVVSMWKQ